MKDNNPKMLDSKGTFTTVFNNLKPHLLAILLMLALVVVYFSPVVFDGKDLIQGDVQSGQGFGRDLVEYHEKTGDYAHWSNRMFSGMPANYTYMPPAPNVFSFLGRIITLDLPITHLGLVFLYLICFYILLISLGCNPWLSFLGTIAYTFASYNFIIIEAGHINKGLVMATMAPLIGGVMLCYRKKYLLGILITLFFTGLNIVWSHQQITYYLLITLIVLAIVYFIYAIKEKTLKDYFKSSAILLVVAGVAVLPSLGQLIPSADYAKETMRGGSVLKTDAEGNEGHAGLDIDYAYQWSYEKMETFTLLVPNLYGGGHVMLDKNSETAKELQQNGYGSPYLPTYWGDQPFTSGPVYAGAIVCFLFVLGLFVVKGPERWWLLAATIISFILSWGRHFEIINNFLFYHLPLYSKFRTPSMALVIAGVTMPFLGILGLKEIFSGAIKKNEILKHLKTSYFITAGLCLFLMIVGGMFFSFTGKGDANFTQQLSGAGFSQPMIDNIIDILTDYRKSMLYKDALRSIVFISLAFAVLYYFLKGKIKKIYIVVIALIALVLLDEWTVDKRYLNNSSFKPKRNVVNAHQTTETDLMILQDKDPDYRVLNLATNTFNESGTAYFHKTIGGYSPAKLRRYQDMIDFHISKEINALYSEIINAQGDMELVNPDKFHVLNMLNTKYFILPVGNGNTAPILNPYAYGNVWFVDSIRWADSPDDEINMIFGIHPLQTACIDKMWEDKLPNNKSLEHTTDTNAYIRLSDYSNPGYLIYESSNSQPQLAVFSEVFYKTWRAYIDGQEVPIVRVNYILRGLEVPAGDHKIEFRCVDEVILKSSKLSLFGSIFVVLIFAGIIFMFFYQRKKKK